MSSPPCRILIVEDESLVAEDLNDRLQTMGYDICGITDTGEEALVQARSLHPDLALLDIHLRGELDGIHVAAELRRTTHIPVVFLTAHADDATLHRAGHTEPFGYVLKPFDERELHAAIEMALYRHRAEQRTHKMERWLSTTLQSIGDGVIATDSQGRVTFLNNVAEALTGWSRRDAIGQPFTEVFALEKDGVRVVAQLLPKALNEGLTINLDEGFTLRTPQGTVIPIDDSIAPIRDEDDRVTGAVVVFRDCSQKLQVQAERRILEQRMQEAQRLESLGVLASGIAHDFNNLLTAITGNVSLCTPLLPTETPARGYLQEIQDAAFRAANLCTQMLAYAGEGNFVVVPLDLSDLAHETVVLMQLRLQQKVVVTMDFPGGLPAVVGDRGQLQQAIINLMMNASDSFERTGGNITVRTSLFEATQEFLTQCRSKEKLVPGEYVMLEVRDNGSGMAPGILSRAFDPFFTTKFQGRGLGLAAVLGIVRSHGGALHVESAPGKGTVFRLLFPPSTEAVAITPKAPLAEEWKGQGRILLVDDEKSIRLAGTVLLQVIGFDVSTASSGEDGLRQFEAPGSDFTAIITDLTMPGMTGLDLYNAIRRSNREVPIILITGYTRETLGEDFRKDPHAAFLQKPFTGEEVQSALAQMMSNPA